MDIDIDFADKQSTGKVIYLNVQSLSYSQYGRQIARKGSRKNLSGKSLVSFKHNQESRGVLRHKMRMTSKSYGFLFLFFIISACDHIKQSTRSNLL